MTYTKKFCAVMSMTVPLMALLAWPGAALAQNVHVTTEQPVQTAKNSKTWVNTGSSNSYMNFSGPSIPDGKMLVIEQFSADVEVNPGERVIVSVTCQGVPGVLPAVHHPVLTSQGVFGGVRGGTEHLSVSLPLRCYTRGGDFGLSMHLVRNSQAPAPASAYSEVSVSGFVQDLP